MKHPALLFCALLGLLHGFLTVSLALSQHVTGLGITLFATSLASYAYRVSFPKVDSPPTPPTAPFSPSGGAVITDYLVQISGDGGSTWATVADGVSSATSATVTGLTNGASSIFRVAAVNAVGTGVPSDSSAAFVPATFGGLNTR